MTSNRVGARRLFAGGLIVNRRGVCHRAGNSVRGGGRASRVGDKLTRLCTYASSMSSATYGRLCLITMNHVVHLAAMDRNFPRSLDSEADLATDADDRDGYVIIDDDALILLA